MSWTSAFILKQAEAEALCVLRRGHHMAQKIENINENGSRPSLPKSYRGHPARQPAFPALGPGLAGFI